MTELLKAVVMLSSTHSSTSTSATAKTSIVLSLQYQQPESHQWSRLNSSIIKAYQIWLIMNVMRRLMLMKSSTFPKSRRSECCRDSPSPSCTRTPSQRRQGPCTASWGTSWNIRDHRCPVDFKCSNLYNFVTFVPYFVALCVQNRISKYFTCSSFWHWTSPS